MRMNCDMAEHRESHIGSQFWHEGQRIEKGGGRRCNLRTHSPAAGRKRTGFVCVLLRSFVHVEKEICRGPYTECHIGRVAVIHVSDMYIKFCDMLDVTRIPSSL